VLVAGPNGAGKTNLLEAVHVATQGFSFRTRREATVIRTGSRTSRVSIAGRMRGGVDFTVSVTLDRAEHKRIVLNGTAVTSQESLRVSLPALAFTPDRLAVVKGPPAIRRAYLDRVVGRLFAARAGIPGEYAQALAQRNAALRRVRAGLSPRSVLVPWDDALVALGQELDAARVAATEELAPRFAEEASRLQLLEATAAYRPAGLDREELAARLDRDLERGTTSAGPHLADLELVAAGADLRAFGSQGQQRVALLALLVAEAEAIASLRGEAPLLLLDDVLSELDDHRRAALLDRLPIECQVLVTATSDRALPRGGRRPDQTIDVASGAARSR
jgi:DNA replication and repair protein RecF